MMIEEMITKDMMMCKQILPTSTMRSIWKTMRRICMLILGLNGLNIGHIKVCVCECEGVGGDRESCPL